MIDRKHLFVCAVALALATATPAAFATLFEYNFADGLGNRDVAGPVAYVNNGIEVTVTAERFGSEADLHINGDTGLGVAGSAAGEGNRIGPGEVLHFEFDPSPVNLLRVITFDTLQNPETIVFDLLVDGLFVGSYDITADDDLFVSVDVSDVAFGGSRFSVVAQQGDGGFRVTALRGEVSEPGMLALLGIGVGGLLLAGRRRRGTR